MAKRIIEEINKIVIKQVRLDRFKNQRKVIKTWLTINIKNLVLGISSDNITENETCIQPENVSELNKK